MTLTNLEISNILTAYNANLKSDMKLPIAVSWKRKTNIKKLQTVWTAVEEMVTELKEKYFTDENTTTDETGKTVLKEKCTAEFMKEHAEIMEQKSDVDISTIKVEDLGNLSLTDLDMETIAFMIEE